MSQVKWGTKTNPKNLSVNPFGYYFWRIKHWWKWRKYKKTDWPFLYIGPDIPRWKITRNTPIRRATGYKGARQGQRWETPDHIQRIIPTSHVIQR